MALTLAIDRQAIVRDVTKGEQLPAYAFIPFGVPETDGGDFRKTGGDFFKEDLEQARKLLADAGYPDGQGFPVVSILYNNNDQHKAIAEAIQAMWKKNLNINISMRNEEWQSYLNDMQRINYDIARAGWSPDYMDAMTFADMFVTDGGNNLTGWSNKEYDRLIEAAKSTDAGNPKARVEDMHKSEKILMDEMPIMPIYFYTQPILIKSNLKDVIIPPFGLEAEFKWAHVE
jgi:oligopeptide transport system substrate-binding protein